MFARATVVCDGMQARRAHPVELEPNPRIHSATILLVNLQRDNPARKCLNNDPRRLARCQPNAARYRPWPAMSCRELPHASTSHLHASHDEHGHCKARKREAQGEQSNRLQASMSCHRLRTHVDDGGFESKPFRCRHAQPSPTSGGHKRHPALTGATPEFRRSLAVGGLKVRTPRRHQCALLSAAHGHGLRVCAPGVANIFRGGRMDVERAAPGRRGTSPRAQLSAGRSAGWAAARRSARSTIQHMAVGRQRPSVASTSVLAIADRLRDPLPTVPRCSGYLTW